MVALLIHFCNEIRNLLIECIKALFFSLVSLSLSLKLTDLFVSEWVRAQLICLGLRSGAIAPCNSPQSSNNFFFLLYFLFFIFFTFTHFLYLMVEISQPFISIASCVIPRVFHLISIRLFVLLFNHVSALALKPENYWFLIH